MKNVFFFYFSIFSIVKYATALPVGMGISFFPRVRIYIWDHFSLQSIAELLAAINRAALFFFFFHSRFMLRANCEQYIWLYFRLKVQHTASTIIRRRRWWENRFSWKIFLNIFIAILHAFRRFLFDVKRAWWVAKIVEWIFVFCTKKVFNNNNFKCVSLFYIIKYSNAL